MKVCLFTTLFVLLSAESCSNYKNPTIMPNDLDAMRDEFIAAIEKTNDEHLFVLANAEAIPTAQYFKSKEWMGKMLDPAFNPYLLDSSRITYKVALANEATQPYDMIWFIRKGEVQYSVIESSYYIVVVAQQNDRIETEEGLTIYLNSLMMFSEPKTIKSIDAKAQEVFSTNPKTDLKALLSWSDRIDVVRKNGLVYVMAHKVDPSSKMAHPSRWFKPYFKEKF